MPRSISNKAVSVVVQLSGKSVAEVQAARGQKLSKAEKQAIKAQLKGEQDSILSGIRSAGGRVDAQFQSALNGVKVRIAEKDVAKLRSLPNVIAVLSVATYAIDNATSVPYIGTPAAWTAAGGPFTGAGIKVGIIDTGIDYTHKNFGGPGTPADYISAHANETLPANPLYFGPGAPRVKGGTDLVGDAYDADNPASIPAPDPNPLDCNGHGSHVAGTAAGSGVTAGGATYGGPYNGATYPFGGKIGPGVAPQANLYAIRVFGCSGSTNVVVEALDWAVDNDMDVVNMSLGSSFGTGGTADALASNNAAAAGVIVVASAGNSGPNPYLAGSPASADRATSVAATDSTPTFPGFSLALLPSGTVLVQNSNNATVSNGTMYTTVLRLTGANKLGCVPGNYPALTSSTLVIVERGGCARVHKAILGRDAGAGAVAMVDTGSGTYPPFEGPITSDPDTGLPVPLVTIPFMGVKGPVGGADDLLLSAATKATLTNTTVPNPGYKKIASFSSSGPRVGDSYLKPDVTAPGVSVFSTAMGTGTDGEYLSGTSMASPHVAGVAALTRQAHPSWGVNDIKAAIENTADSTQVASYAMRLAGSGLVQPAKSVITQVDAIASADDGNAALNFGYVEVSSNFSKTKKIKLINDSGSSVTFNVTTGPTFGPAGQVYTFAPTVTVPANGSTLFSFTLAFPAANGGDQLGFTGPRGLINFAPSPGGANNGVSLHVPFYSVSHALSLINATSTNGGVANSGNSFKVKIKAKNSGGAAISDFADYYAWGLTDPNEGPNTHDPDGSNNSNDVRAVGVLACPVCNTVANPLLQFAINGYRRYSNNAQNEYDVNVDVDNDGTTDYILVLVDNGLVTTGSFDGRARAFVFSTRSAGTSTIGTDLETDASTVFPFAFASQFCRVSEPCLSTGNPRFTYSVQTFDLLDGESDEVDGTASFNAFSPSMTTEFGAAPIAPGASMNETIQVDKIEWAATPALGAMVVHYNNPAGPSEASLVPFHVTLPH